MLKIRQEQMDVLAQIPRQEFLRKMLVYMNDHFPDECEQIGAASLEKFIQEGIAKAEGYGIESLADVAQFLALQGMFGVEFDRQHGWAREILANSSVTLGSAKIMLLNKAAVENLPQTTLAAHNY